MRRSAYEITTTQTHNINTQYVNTNIIMSSSEIQHARDYVTRVKTSLGQNSNQYKLFLTTLKSYRTRQLSPTQVISRINDIFSEDNVVESGNRRELILGTLNVCLYGFVLCL